MSPTIVAAAVSGGLVGYLAGLATAGRALRWPGDRVRAALRAIRLAFRDRFLATHWRPAGGISTTFGRDTDGGLVCRLSVDGLDGLSEFSATVHLGEASLADATAILERRADELEYRLKSAKREGVRHGER